MTMFRVLILGVLSSTVLAVAISTGAEAQGESIHHKFRCPDSVSGKTNPVGEIGSDPSYSLQSTNFALSAQFASSSVVGQKVSCVYKNQGHGDLVYSYTVKRKLSNCQNVGKREFTCVVR
jgi:hypothetical protein